MGIKLILVIKMEITKNFFMVLVVLLIQMRGFGMKYSFRDTKIIKTKVMIISGLNYRQREQLV